MNKTDCTTNIAMKLDKLTGKNTEKLDNCCMREHGQSVGANSSR